MTKILVLVVVFIVAVANCASFYSKPNDDVHVSGSFRVAGENEEISSNYQEPEHPFFQLEAMKIARAYLDKQYAKERAAN